MFPELPFLPRLVQTFWPFSRPARNLLDHRVEPPPLQRTASTAPEPASDRTEPRATLLHFPSAAISDDGEAAMTRG